MSQWLSYREVPPIGDGSDDFAQPFLFFRYVHCSKMSQWLSYREVPPISHPTQKDIVHSQKQTI